VTGQARIATVDSAAEVTMHHSLPSLLLTSFALCAQDPTTPPTTPAPTPQAAPPTPAAFDLDAAFAAALPPLAESRWTLIPWRHSLTDALAEAKATTRPVYLFVNDGDVDSGVC
jgi:hypothetical protein